MEIQPAVKQRRKEIRDEAKRILLERPLYHPHLFKTQIADDTSWIIVNETIWDECWVHSVSDNIPDINEEQDL